jgi:hypothetical protein
MKARLELPDPAGQVRDEILEVDDPTSHPPNRYPRGDWNDERYGEQNECKEEELHLWLRLPDPAFRRSATHAT